MDGTIHSKNPFAGTRMVPSGKISFRWHKMDTDRFPTSAPVLLAAMVMGVNFWVPNWSLFVHRVNRKVYDFNIILFRSLRRLQLFQMPKFGILNNSGFLCFLSFLSFLCVWSAWHCDLHFCCRLSVSISAVLLVQVQTFGTVSEYQNIIYILNVCQWN